MVEVHFNKAALPGIIATVGGAIIVAALYGWDYGLAFFVGGSFGTLRYDN